MLVKDFRAPAKQGKCRVTHTVVKQRGRDEREWRASREIEAEVMDDKSHKLKKAKRKQRREGEAKDCLWRESRHHGDRSRSDAVSILVLWSS